MGAGNSGSTDREVARLDLSIEYLHALVHELRNPLAPMRNVAHVLRTMCTEPRQQQCIEVWERQLASLTRVLDELTDVISARQSGLRLSKQTIELTEVINSALRSIRPAVHEGGQHLSVSLPTAPMHVRCDPLRLAQIVRILLENAMRRALEDGTIALGVRLDGESVCIEVRDDGAGISAEQLSLLFDSRAAVGSFANAGYGVNLAIARQIVELHGGSIEATGEGVGRGNQFTIRLPLEAQPSPQFVPLQRGEHQPRRIMVIDDHEDSATSLCETFAAAGHSVVAARTGELGLTLAETFRPEAAVIDLGLPGIDGFEVGRRMRESAATARALLIAVTGFSIKQFRDLSAYSVFRHYLLKPASPETLLQVIENTLQDAERA